MPKRLLALGAVMLLLAVGLVWLLLPGQPSGPVPIVWDKTACAECRMHVGEPAFAAQLQTGDGRVLNFDDPGCLFDYVAHEQPAIAAIYFRHSEHDRWLTQAEVGFVSRAPTPMGYGLAAVEKERPGAIGFDQALERVKQKSRVGRAP